MYKTIALELLQSHPNLHRQLRLSRKLLSEVDRYATSLRAAHLELSTEMEPSAALELAVSDLEERIAQEDAKT